MNAAGLAVVALLVSDLVPVQPRESRPVPAAGDRQNKGPGKGAAAPGPSAATGGQKASAGIASADELLKGLSALPGFEAKFREEKLLALLEAPLVSHGTLHFAPPSLMARHVTAPAPGSLVIDGTTLRFGEPGRAGGSIDLARNPVARLFAETFVLVLRGDRTALERIYRLQFKPAPSGTARWELTLVPLRPEMAKVVSSIVLRGTGLTIAELDIHETGGDRSHTTFSAVNLARRYSPEEKTRIFRVR